MGEPHAGGGALGETDFNRRRYARLYARRKREQALDVARTRGRRTCPRRRGHYGVCGGILEHTVRRDGTLVTTCPRCERKKRGICENCPNPVAGQKGKALRCRACLRVERVAAAQRHRLRDPARYRSKARRQTAARRADPVRHARDLAVKKAWRERNKARIKLQKRKWRLNPDRPDGYSSREKYEAYHRAYRKSHRVHYRELMRRKAADRRAARAPIICACGCGVEIPWEGRYRPRKWLREHDPHPSPPTPEEVFVKTTATAIRVLERGAERIRAKLKGIEAMQQELDVIERVVAELKKVGGDVVPITRRRTAKAS